MERRRGSARDAAGLRSSRSVVRRALEIYEHLDSASPQLGAALCGLGRLAAMRGRSRRGRATVPPRALSVYEASPAAEHPGAAAALDGLGSVLRDQGNYRQAEKLLSRALAMQEGLLAKEHPDVAATLNNLAGPLPTCRAICRPRSLSIGARPPFKRGISAAAMRLPPRRFTTWLIWRRRRATPPKRAVFSSGL